MTGGRSDVRAGAGAPASVTGTRPVTTGPALVDHTDGSALRRAHARRCGLWHASARARGLDVHACSRRPPMSAHVATTTLIVVSVLLQSVLASTPALGAPADENEVKTALRGVDFRLQRIQTLRGSCTLTSRYSPRYAQAWRKGFPAADGLTFGSMDLERVLFSVDFVEGRWDIQAVELVTSGYDPLGVRGEFGLVEGQEGNPPSSYVPQLRSVCDGHVYTLVRFGSGNLSEARIWFREDDSIRKGIASTLRRYMLLAVANQAPGAYIADTWPAPQLSELDQLLGYDCYRLSNERMAEGGPTRQVAWIAPRAAFALLRWDDMGAEKRDPTAGYRRVLTASGLQQHGADLWLPTETVEHVYTYAKGDADAWAYSRLCRFTELEVNQPIDWTQAVAAPPLGAMVYDYRVAGSVEPWGRTDEALRLFKAGELAPPPSDPQAAAPLTGREFAHSE